MEVSVAPYVHTTGGQERFLGYAFKQVNTAAAALYDWLVKEQSALRGLIGLMSSGGCYWTAYCSELTGRSAVDRNGGAIQKNDFVAAAVERLCKEGGVGYAAPSLASGLFQ